MIILNITFYKGEQIRKGIPKNPRLFPMFNFYGDIQFDYCQIFRLFLNLD